MGYLSLIGGCASYCRTIDLTGPGGEITVIPTGGGPYQHNIGFNIPIISGGEECPNQPMTDEAFKITLIKERHID
eukprot:TRINITY_DN3616_c0_g1_i1.p1 TRINITY_DN3616_c0_g1~~TRINITY_DN3616_c0_g1_i1.p1  ORF type:complete len:75 (-),score=13.41 TRINITY_DN3616_c0_g1_i1:184-408(-)